ncbi:LAETG motif-containing sortase-dependent surface protein [Streptomyces violens]|uniref:LAETG motif-containing sortase-dependent surface protein n=1 Tax=Streptomyces violens TaxID=66377 RepID=UPI0004C0F1EA|nr:LAETG motif-containing sortase-dependent surface protein [Streptomyces violens]
MKLRRALTAAAATAVLAPAALLAAPAAYATEGDPTTPPSASPSEVPEEPAPSANAPETEAPTEEPSESAEPTPPPSEEEPTTEPSASAPTTEEPTEGTTEKPTGTPSATPSETPTEEPVCEKESEEAAITTTLRGLPSQVVAGSGWHNFTFRATNVSEQAMKSVDAYVMLSAIDKDDFDDVSHLLTVQWLDEASGTWHTIGDEGYFASTADLASGEYSDAKLRLKVDAKTPGSYGFAFAIGAYHDEKDVCGFSEGSEYEFDVLVAGSKPGTVPPATGKPGGKKPSKPAPQGGMKELPVSGKLAETGSSSALPMIAAVAGVTMAVGAGAIFVVRRRKTDGAAA